MPAVMVTQQQQRGSNSSANTGGNGYGLERLLFHIVRSRIAGTFNFTGKTTGMACTMET